MLLDLGKVQNCINNNKNGLTNKIINNDSQLCQNLTIFFQRKMLLFYFKLLIGNTTFKLYDRRAKSLKVIFYVLNDS